MGFLYRCRYAIVGWIIFLPLVCTSRWRAVLCPHTKRYVVVPGDVTMPHTRWYSRGFLRCAVLSEVAVVYVPDVPLAGYHIACCTDGMTVREHKSVIHEHTVGVLVGRELVSIYALDASTGKPISIRLLYVRDERLIPKGLPLF